MLTKKKYWIWNEKFNSTDFKLGNDIRILESNGKVIKDPIISEKYYGINEIPWVIETEGYKIKSIFFRNNFFIPFDDEFILWEKELLDFEFIVNKYLIPINRELKYLHSDIFYVVFKDYFVSIAGIIRNS